MKTGIQIKGVTASLKKLDVFDAKVYKKLKKGLQNAGAYAIKESVKIVPVDTGDLKDSAYGGKGVPVRRTATGMWTKVGYSHKWAMRVHEMPGTHWKQGTPRRPKRGRGGIGNMWDVTGEPKFLEKIRNRKESKIKRIIKRSVMFTRSS
jgi:hypothetical protein